MWFGGEHRGLDEVNQVLACTVRVLRGISVFESCKNSAVEPSAICAFYNSCFVETQQRARTTALVQQRDTVTGRSSCTRTSPIRPATPPIKFTIESPRSCPAPCNAIV